MTFITAIYTVIDWLQFVCVFIASAAATAAPHTFPFIASVPTYNTQRDQGGGRVFILLLLHSTNAGYQSVCVCLPVQQQGFVFIIHKPVGKVTEFTFPGVLNFSAVNSIDN